MLSEPDKPSPLKTIAGHQSRLGKPMTSVPVDRDIGRHDAQIESLQAEVVLIRKDLDEIKRLLERTKGGWQALTVVAGIAGAVGAAVMKLVTMGASPPH